MPDTSATDRSSPESPVDTPPVKHAALLCFLTGFMTAAAAFSAIDERWGFAAAWTLCALIDGAFAFLNFRLVVIDGRRKETHLV